LLRNINVSGWDAVKFSVRTLPIDADAGTIKELVDSIALKSKENSNLEE